MDSLHEFCGLCRQRDAEAAALSGTALRGDRSAVLLHDALAERETQPAAVGAAVGLLKTKINVVYFIIGGAVLGALICR